MVVCIASISQRVHSLVASIDSSVMLATPNLMNNIKKEVAATSTNRSRNFKIRKSKEEDLSTVSCLLAHDLVVGNSDVTRVDSNNPYLPLKNWNSNTKRLRIRSDIQKQVKERLKAVQEGMLHIESNSFVSSSDETIEAIWSHETFREKIQKAAQMSTEPSAWQAHNYFLVPSDLRLFQHLMLSVECKYTSSVIGFCEVAMLRAPESSHFNHDELFKFRPIVTNVVVCPLQRRRGIGSRLLDMVTRYVATKWSPSSTLGLFVDKDNENALSLYTKKGFSVVGMSDDNPNLLYMECQLGDASFQ